MWIYTSSPRELERRLVQRQSVAPPRPAPWLCGARARDVARTSMRSDFARFASYVETAFACRDSREGRRSRPSRSSPQAKAGSSNPPVNRMVQVLYLVDSSCPVARVRSSCYPVFGSKLSTDCSLNIIRGIRDTRVCPSSETRSRSRERVGRVSFTHVQGASWRGPASGTMAHRRGTTSQSSCRTPCSRTRSSA